MVNFHFWVYYSTKAVRVCVGSLGLHHPSFIWHQIILISHHKAHYLEWQTPNSDDTSQTVTPGNGVINTIKINNWRHKFSHLMKSSCDTPLFIFQLSSFPPSRTWQLQNDWAYQRLRKNMTRHAVLTPQQIYVLDKWMF